jgi:hypothetical protein
MDSVEAQWSCLVSMPNAKVSDGSQPPGTSATPLGVPAGYRSLDRHGSARMTSLVSSGLPVVPSGQPANQARGKQYGNHEQSELPRKDHKHCACHSSDEKIGALQPKAARAIGTP